MTTEQPRAMAGTSQTAKYTASALDMLAAIEALRLRAEPYRHRADDCGGLARAIIDTADAIAKAAA